MKAKDLKPGDKVLDADGNTLTVKKVGKGFSTRSVMIEWREHWANWSHLNKNAEVSTGEVA